MGRTAFVLDGLIGLRKFFVLFSSLPGSRGQSRNVFLCRGFDRALSHPEGWSRQICIGYELFQRSLATLRVLWFFFANSLGVVLCMFKNDEYHFHQINSEEKN